MRSTVQLLLRRGADPNAASCPMPVLFFAVRSGDVEMVRLLLQNDAEPGVTLPDSVCVCVCAFSKKKSAKVICWFLSNCLEFQCEILRAYVTILSTLNCQFHTEIPSGC